MDGEGPGVLAQADSAGGSPIVVPRTPLETRNAAASDFNDDVFIEAATTRQYYLEEEDVDESCCWNPFSSSFCKSSRNSAHLNEALLRTPPFSTSENEQQVEESCCNLFCPSNKTGITVRHRLPRLSSTILGIGRQTPSGSVRISSPISPRQRASSSHTETISLNGTPQRLRNSEYRPGQVEVVRKIVMLGARSSGKSSVVHRFAEHRFGAAYDPTIESTIRAKIAIRGVTFLCDLLDTAGQDEYSNFSRQATVGVHGYCMVFSVTSMQSFQAIQKIHDRITELVGSYTVPIVLVGTKSDDETHREVPSAAGDALAESWGATYVECSARSDYRIEDVFVTLLFEIERDSGLLASKDSEDSDEIIKGRSCTIM